MKNKLFILVYLLILFYSFSEDQGLMYFKKALELEKEYDYHTASKYYYESYKINKDEKILLKSARINENIDESAKLYDEFIKTFPSSRFRLLSRFELANLYLMNNLYDKALIEYDKLIKLAKGTIYFDKSVIKIAGIYFIQNDYKNVIDFLFKNLNELNDYDAIANVNYLFGKVYLKQNN